MTNDEKILAIMRRLEILENRLGDINFNNMVVMALDHEKRTSRLEEHVEWLETKERG